MNKTAKEIIALADELNPNAYSDEVKAMWLNEAEHMLQTEIFCLAPCDVTEYVPYAEKKETELSLGAGDDKIYIMYLQAMIDFANKEYSAYNNDIALYNEYLDTFAKRYIRTHKEGVPPISGMCVSAYALAQKHGFTGSEEEWLSSLKGDTGPKGEKGEKGDKGDKGEKGESVTIEAYPEERNENAVSSGGVYAAIKKAGNTYANALKEIKNASSVTIVNMSPMADEVKLRVHSKNMLPAPTSGSTTAGGLTFTSNSDGTLTVNGTAESSAAYTLVSASAGYMLPIGKYYFSVFEQSGEAYKNITYKKLTLRNGGTTLKTYMSNKFEITKEDVEAGYDRIAVSFHIGSNAAGIVFDNAVFNFQIEAGENGSDEYSQFVPFGTDAVIYKNGSEALSATLDSGFPEMTVAAEEGDIFTTDENIVMDAEYPKDINKAFTELEEKITNAIISLGGEI